MIGAKWDWTLQQRIARASNVAELVQWANEEFGGDGWKFKASGASFIHGWLDELLITVLITSWGVSWIVIDYTQPWNEQVIGSGRIEGQP